jgi:hypothetical protein
MQAEAIVINPCFYKGFFSTTEISVWKYFYTATQEGSGILVYKKAILAIDSCRR